MANILDSLFSKKQSDFQKSILCNLSLWHFRFLFDNQVFKQIWTKTDSISKRYLMPSTPQAYQFCVNCSFVFFLEPVQFWHRNFLYNPGINMQTICYYIIWLVFSNVVADEMVTFIRFQRQTAFYSTSLFSWNWSRKVCEPWCFCKKFACISLFQKKRISTNDN